MPYSSRYRRASANRRRKRQARFRKNRNAYVTKYRRNRRAPLRSFMPKRNLVRLKYVDTVSVDPGVGAIASYNFSTNSCYDPNATGTGHQPMGFDQYMTFYDHYTVIGAKITVQGQSEQTSVPIIAGIYKNDDTTFLPTTAPHACELPGVKYRFVAEKDNGTKSTFTLTSKFSHRELPIVKALGSNEVRGTVNSSPSEQTYWTIFVGPADGTSDLNAHVLWVHIEYLVVFTEPKELAQS